MNTNMQHNNNKKTGLQGIEVVILMLLLMALPLGYIIYSERNAAESETAATVKSITIEVINSASETTSYEVETDAEYLREAMEEADGLEFSGTEGDYGIMLTTVNGEVADYNENGAYWSITVNGEYGNYGIDQQPIADGETYQLVYTKS